MKYTLSILTIAISMACNTHTQSSGDLSIPPLKLHVVNSGMLISPKNLPGGKPLVFVYFEPDCEHCRKETELITTESSKTTGLTFIFISPMPIETLKSFSKTFKLNDHRNIILARDSSWLFYHHFKPRAIPFITIYNKEKKLIGIYEGPATIEEIVKMADQKSE